MHTHTRTSHYDYDYVITHARFSIKTVLGELLVSYAAKMNESNTTTLPENFEDVEVWLRVLHGIILLLLLLSSTIGNCLVLLLVFCNKSLQYRSVISSLGLVAADMIIALSWSIAGIGSTIAGQCPFGEAGCSFLGAVTSVGIYARWCTVALITLERFCSIVFPFFYLKWSKPMLIVLVIISWLIPLATILPWLAGVGVYVYRIRLTSCTIFCGSDRGCFYFYITLYGTFVVIGGILPTVLYFMMCVIGQRKHYKMKHIALGTFSTDTESQSTNDSSSKEKQSSSKDSTTQKINSVPGTDINVSSTQKPDSKTDTNSRTNSTSNSISKSDSKSDSESLGNNSGTKKILTTFFMIFINVFLTQLPIYVTSALRSKEEIYNSIPLWLNFLFVYIYLLGSVLDPLLIIRNKDFRDTIKKVLRPAKIQSANVKEVLLDFAKMSSLLEMTPSTAGRRGMRRYSCPGNMKRAAAAPVISKARSFDGYVYSDQEPRYPMTIPSLILSVHRESLSTQEPQEVEREEACEHTKKEEVRPPVTQPLDGVDER